jgi:hypothetical protein
MATCPQAIDTKRPVEPPPPPHSIVHPHDDVIETITIEVTHEQAPLLPIRITVCCRDLCREHLPQAVSAELEETQSSPIQGNDAILGWTDQGTRHALNANAPYLLYRELALVLQFDVKALSVRDAHGQNHQYEAKDVHTPDPRHTCPLESTKLY